MSDDIFNDLRSASNEPTEAILVSSDLLIEAAEEIERLRALVSSDLLIEAAEEIDRLRQLITTWADAEDLLEYDVDDPWSDLRKAVGR